jgi:hypothetical protein
MMRNEHHILRTMKRELKIDMMQSPMNSFRGVEKLYNDLQDARSNSPRPSRPKAGLASPTATAPHSDVISNSLARRRSVDYNSKAWMQKRRLSAKSIPSKVQDFIKALFSLLNGRTNGTIPGQTLLNTFAGLGLATDTVALTKVTFRQTLLNFYKADSIGSVVVTQESLETLCKADAKIDTILAVLQNSVLEERNKRPKTIAVTRSLMLEGLRSQGGTAELKKLSGETLFSIVSEDPVSLAEQMALVKRWWEELNSILGYSGISSRITDKLVSLRIASDNTRARKLMDTLIGVKTKLDFADFSQIFMRSMLKGAIQTLSLKISNNFPDLEDSEKLSAYKRALLLTGLTYLKHDVSLEDGALALTAAKHLRGASPPSLTE